MPRLSFSSLVRTSLPTRYTIDDDDDDGDYLIDDTSDLLQFLIELPYIDIHNMYSHVYICLVFDKVAVGEIACRDCGAGWKKRRVLGRGWY